MYVINGQLKGTADILFNRFADPSVLDSGVSGGKNQGTEARRKEAALKIYTNHDGELCVPAWNLKKLALDGARESKIKLDKTPLWKHINAMVFAETDPTFGVKAFDYIHECVGRIPPRTGAAAIIRRPALNRGWLLTFQLNVLADIPVEKLRAAFDVAGVFVGLGSWRPNWGRFEVEKWSTGDVGKTRTRTR